MQFQNEAVSGYLNKTAVLGETATQLEVRMSVFIKREQVGSFPLLPGGMATSIR